MMAFFAAILYMEKPELNQEFRQAHLDYLAALVEQEKVHLKGPFVDGAGGMVVYKADSLEEAQELAQEDPYVKEGVRRLELHEWGI
jgi:uncharacterized protein YciI